MLTEMISHTPSDEEGGSELLNDIRLEVKLKNNVLWNKIHDKFPNVAAFCKAHKGLGINATQVGRLLLFKVSPFRQVRVGKTNLFTKEYRNACLKLEKALKCPAEVLFPEELYEKMMELPATTVVELSSFSNLALPEKHELLSLPAPEEDPLSQADRQELGEKIQDLLKTLTFREREIIKLRYGLGYDYIHTLEEVGKIFKITRERVRMIEAGAIRKLQDPARSNRLKPFVK